MRIALNARAFLALVLICFTCAAGQAQQPPKASSESTANIRQAGSAVRQARAAALNIKESFQRGLVLDEIGAAEAACGDIASAVDTANRAYPHTSNTLDAIGKQLVKPDQSGKRQLVASKLKGGGSSSVFFLVAVEQAEKGDINSALRTAAKIRAPEVRSSALKEIAQKQSSAGDYSGARRSIARANAAYPSQRSSPDDVEMLIAEGQLARGDREAARATVASLSSAEMRSAGLISGAQKLLDLSDNSTADLWIEEALRGLPDGTEFEFFRYMAIPLQVKAGKKEHAMQAASALAKDLRVKGYTAVAVTCAEEKDTACVNSALVEMQSAAKNADREEGLSEFVARLMILHVTAALVNKGEFEVASQWLDSVEQRVDDRPSMSVEREIHLQRVIMLAQQGRFDDARLLALKMHPNSVSEVERGTALRTIAALQTKEDGVGVVEGWAQALTESEDRAYAFLGIAEALLGTDDVKLPYSAIFIH